MIASAPFKYHLKQQPIIINNTIIKHRLRWLGHILRLSPQELTRISLLTKPCEGWCQKRGGPIKNLADIVRKDFERYMDLYGRKRSGFYYCKRQHQITKPLQAVEPAQPVMTAIRRRKIIYLFVEKTRQFFQCRLNFSKFTNRFTPLSTLSISSRALEKIQPDDNTLVHR